MFLDEIVRLECPVCETALSQKQIANDRRLARCRDCGTLLRIVVAGENGESAATPFSWPESGQKLSDVKTEPHRLHPALTYRPADSRLRVEVATRYPYPNLQCPYCEHLNYDASGGSEAGWRTQQYCANCGADLKKECLVCSYPLYVLDHFCGRCRSDQERAEYQFEAIYWQRFNEGKRLAEAGEWEAARRELSLFFGPDQETADFGYNVKEVRNARQVYRSSITGQDRGLAQNLYRQAGEELTRQVRARQRAMQNKRLLKYGAGAAVLVAMGVWSALNLGAWWSIFVLIPAVGLVVLFLLVLLLVHFGAGFN